MLHTHTVCISCIPLDNDAVASTLRVSQADRKYSRSAKCTCNALKRKEENRFMYVQLRSTWRFLATYLFQALNRYWRLLAHYLQPQWPRMGLLAVILGITSCVQVMTPLVASRFIDQATSGGDLRYLIVLALLTMGLALAGQGLAVVETYVAENVSWAATNALRADLVAHLLRLDATFHTAHTPGELIERVDGDVATLARFFSRFVV